jgi:homoserine kinase
MHVRICAPASTANLGPGFDCLGAALSLEFELTAETGGGSWSVSGGEPVKPDLILAAAALVAGDLPELNGTLAPRIPIGAGLGSSGAAVAAGLLLGCALAGREPDPAELLELGTPLEGHPDNLAASLYGGLTIVVPSGGKPAVLRAEPVRSVRPCIVLPDERLPTAEARAALPGRVPMRDAVSNLSWSSGLVALLTGAVEPTPERLLACTEDALHQPHRAPLMPRTAETIRALRQEGIAACVSGAGPSVLCLVTDDRLERFRRIASGVPATRTLELEWNLTGARIEEVHE